MHWEELTGDQFPEAVAMAQGVCLLPLSCIERHSHHLPLGTDMYIGRELCRRAAEIEPALVFPDFIFTQILEARHCPGTIAIEPDLIMRLLDNTCREIARNGEGTAGPTRPAQRQGFGGQAYTIETETQTRYVIDLVLPRGAIQLIHSVPRGDEQVQAEQRRRFLNSLRIF